MNTLDIVVLVIIGISVLVAYVKGFIKTVFVLLSSIVVIAIALLISPKVSEFVIENTEFDTLISEKSIELLDLEGKTTALMPKEDELGILDGVPVPDLFKELLIKNNNTEIYELLGVSKLSDYIGAMVATVAVNALSFIGVMLVTSILVNILVTLLDLISHLPVLNEINKFAGAGVGLIFGVLIIWVLDIVLSFVLSIQATSQISSLIESSIIAKFLYDNNPLMGFLMDVTNILKF